MRGVQSLVAIIALGTLFIIGPHPALPSDGQPDANAVGAGRNQTLVIGKVTDDPKKQYKRLKAMADYAVAHMGDLGIRQSQVLFAKNNAIMIRYLRQGKIDWVTETPFSAVQFVEKGSAEILLRRWKKGVAQYHTIMFARKDRHIESLADLRGKTIAFEDPGSTTAFLLPAATLIKEGIPLVQLATPREKPPADMVGYIFAKSEVNAPAWVYRGIVDAGAFSNLDWDDSDRMIASWKKEIQIFHRTDPIPRALELVPRDLNPEIKARLKSVLLKAHEDPEAKKALKAYKKTTRFDEMNQGMLESMDQIKALSDIIAAGSI